MFNNIIYFILVLLIFHIHHPAKSLEDSFGFSALMLSVTWMAFAICCRFGFQGLLKGIRNGSFEESRLSNQYQGLIAKLSVLAILLFAFDIYVLNIKYWILEIPGFDRFSVFQGLLGLSLFLSYLCIIWHSAFPLYAAIFRTGINKGSYIKSNLRLNLPIIFPWVAITFAVDILEWIPWPGEGHFLDTIQGQIVFIAGSLSVLAIFLPGFIQYWWGCRPLEEESGKARELTAFLRDKGFKYRRLLKWPIFEGRMMTAGIMGIFSRYRYVLMTDSLVENLSVEELKAVLAHEMAHAKYRHLLIYIVFLVGYVILSMGLFDALFVIVAASPYFVDILSEGELVRSDLFSLLLSIPMLMSLFLYFRYLMGFFMRHFERQADLYSAAVMGSPRHTISSLEKIALLSGKSRNLPSWHHFSIRERVDCLWRYLRDPNLISRHNRFLLSAFSIYMVCLVGLGYVLHFGPMNKHLTYTLIERMLNEQIAKEPHKLSLYQELAMIYHQRDRIQEAIGAYEKIIDLDPHNAVSINNLAWILVTSPDESIRDDKRGLDLAKRAVALERSPIYLDTLAEAFYVNGFQAEAVATIREAISLAIENRDYYEKQLAKFSHSGND
jgi:Zn-dependent protease with chaperone function